MNCIIVDDEALAREAIEILVKDTIIYYIKIGSRAKSLKII